MKKTKSFIGTVFIAALIAAAAACDHSSDDGTNVQSVMSSDQAGIEMRPLAARSASDGPMFELLDADQTGIDLKTIVDEAQDKKYLYHSPWSTGGVAIGDVNKDGRPDVYLVSGPDSNRLYIQDKDLVFRNDAAAAGVGGGDAWGGGAAMVDIDNDGDLDIYVCNFEQPNQLFINQKDGQFFEESAEQYGLAVVDGCLLPAFCDFDNDGDLDLYILTNRIEDPDGRSPQPPVEYHDGVPYLKEGYDRYYQVKHVADKRYEVDVAARQDYLFRNDGNGTFTDVTKAAGIQGRAHGLAATWFDFNHDGLVDLYVSNDFADPDRLYRNNGDGTFTDVAADHLPYTAWFSMGADCGDINNDGRIDLMTTDMAATTHYKAKVSMGDMSDKLEALTTLWPRQIMRNCLFISTGTDRFKEVAYLAGVATTDWTWGVRLSDFDNDGRIDMFFTNGAARHFSHSDFGASFADRIGKTDWDLVRNNPRLDEANIALRNEGDYSFRPVSKQWGLDFIGVSSAAAQGDLDGDGDLDMVVMNLDEVVHVYRNNSPDGHRSTIELRGSDDNSLGVGAVVTLRSASGVQIRQMLPTTGFQSHNQHLIHFGLGEDDRIDQLKVQWPNGHTQIFHDLPADHHLTITQSIVEPTESRLASNEDQAKSTLFEKSDITAAIIHREKLFDDFKRQPLLPGKHSQLGPGIAVGDINGDGNDDIFIGGAKGQAGRVLMNRKGRLEAVTSSIFEADMEYEDMGALFFDAEGDGDLDLYVVSGGVECEPGDDVLKDRLYLNDGKGIFSKALDDALPESRDSGSCVVGTDYDGDGDVDLFIGGRVIPGQYPVHPNSRLLRNDGGRFQDVTDTIAPGLRNVGLVNGAVWSDATGDGRSDLLVACEWGPVRVFENTSNGLIDRTKESGLAELTGWWNGITAGDVDLDGDMDYVVTNVGWNTKYGVANQKKPAYLYFGDFEQKGRMRLVEAKVGDDCMLPVRGLSCSSNAMPMVRQKLPTFHQFASATLADIYTDQLLEQSLQLEAKEFQSGVLINDGAGKFTFNPLPRIAQASPGYGVVVSDVDDDGLPDIYMVQNFYTREPETGLWRGGISICLKGDGKGHFQSVGADMSGLIADGDAKALVSIDVNGDGWKDFMVTQNNDALLTFLRNKTGKVKPTVIRVHGPSPNPNSLGAIVSVVRKDGSRQRYEIHGGSGYLSQSSSAITLSSGVSPPTSVTVRWSDGAVTTSPVVAGQPVVIKHPEIDSSTVSRN